MSTIKRDHRYCITPEHLILDPRISDRAFRLWCRLDRYAGDDGNAMPTRETLAIELDTSPSSIDRAMRELVKAGWLRVVQNPGASSNYVLLNAPTVATQKLVEESRKQRKMATVGRREKAQERDTAKKRKQRAGANVQSSASVQVSTPSPVTSDEGSDDLSPVTGDEGALVMGDEGSLVTGDEDKEASFKEASVEGGSEPSLRSGPAEAEESTVLPIEGMPALTGEVVESPKQQAYRIVRAYLDWFEQTTGAPVVDRNRIVEALRKNYVEKALESGATEDQIKRALANSGSELPHMDRFRRLLREAMGGTNPNVVSIFDRQVANGYTDDVWTKKATEQAEPETPEQMRARLDEMFGTGTEQ